MSGGRRVLHSEPIISDSFRLLKLITEGVTRGRGDLPSEFLTRFVTCAGNNKARYIDSVLAGSPQSAAVVAKESFIAAHVDKTVDYN